MPPTAAIRRYAAIPACLFLFILPFAHTVALRNLSLFVTVLSAAYLWYREPPPPVPCRLPLLFWIGVCWVSLLWSIDPHYTFGELRNEVGYTMAAFLAFYGLTRDMADLRYWWYVLLGGLCILSLIAIANYVQRGAWDMSGEVSGLLGDRNSYSTYIVLVAPLALLTALVPSRGPLRKLGWTGLLLALISGSFTLNRMMWPSLIVMALLLFLLYLRKRSAERPVGLPGLAAGVLLLAVFAGQFAMVSMTKGGAQQGSLTAVEKSFAEDPRLLIWSYARERIAEKPFIGHGYGRGILKDQFQRHFGNPLYWHGHNMLLNYFLELGVLGCVALTWLTASLIRELWRLYASDEGQTRELGLLGLAIFAGIFVKTLTDDILIRDNALLFWALMGIILGAGHRRIAASAAAAVSS